MLSASSRLLQFDEREEAGAGVIYAGNQHLIEYTIGGVAMHYHNDRDFAMLVVEGEKPRPLVKLTRFSTTRGTASF